MKTSLALSCVLATLLVTGAASAAKKTFTGTFSGAQEKPDAVTTDGAGSVTVTLDDTAKTLCGTMTFTGLTGVPTAAHFHEGAPDGSGGPFVTLTAGASPIKIDQKDLDATTIGKLVGGQFYGNLHTAAHGGGEVRANMTEGGTEQSCGTAVVDAGSSSGSTTSSSGSTTSSSGSTTSSSGSTTSSGAAGSTTSSSGSTTSSGSTGAAAPAAADDSGCSTTNSSAPGGGLALALGVGVAVAAISRARRKQR